MADRPGARRSGLLGRGEELQRVRVVHRRLGELYGDLLWLRSGQARVKLDVFERAAEVAARYVSDAEGDVQDEYGMATKRTPGHHRHAL